MPEEKKFKAVIEVGGGIGSSLKNVFAALRGDSKALGNSLGRLKGRAKNLSDEMAKGLGGPEASQKLAALNARILATERAIASAARLRNIGSRFGQLGSAIKSSAIMVTGASVGTTAALVALGKSVGDYADNAAEAASSVSMETNELIRFKYAANDVGTGAENLQKSIAKMQLGLEKARKDGGGNVFKLLHLDARKLSRQAPGKQLEAIAEAFSKYNGKVSKTAIAMALFGKSGAEMVNFLSLGKAGLAEYGKEAESLGLTISKELVEKGDEFGRTQLRVGAALDGLKNNLGQGILPALNQLGNAFKDLVAEHPEEIKKLGEEIGKALLSAGESIKSFGAFLWENGDVIKTWFERLGGMKTVLVALVAIPFTPLIVAAAMLGAAFVSLGVAIGGVGSLVVGAFLVIGGAIWKLKENWAGVEVVFRAGMIWLGMKWAELTEGVKGFGAAIRDYALGAFTALKDQAGKTFDWIGSKLSAVTETFGKVKNFFGGSDSKPADAAGVDGARANGGPVSAGKRYLVGERGPEIFAPRTSGQIIPNGGGSRSDNRTFNVTINAAPGMSERTLADLVIARLNGRQAALAGGALYD